MNLYHVYVHYKNKEGKETRQIQFNYARETVEQQVAIPYMKNKQFLLGGKVFHPSNIIQILIFESEKPAAEYILPNGNTMRNEPDTFYIAKCLAKAIAGIYSCNSEFITSPPEEKKELMDTPTIIIDEKRKVFIVHGTDENQALRLQKYLTRTLGINAEMFEDFKEKSGSKTIIEQLEYIEKNVSYAFVLVTPDDLGCLREDIDKCKTKFMLGKENIEVDNMCKILDKLNTRARQNVVFENGLFIGALGRDNVCCLLQEDTKERPSDINGILYVGFKKSVKEAFPEITGKLRNLNLVKT